MHIRTYLFLLAAGILLPVILLSSLALGMLQNAQKDAALGGLSASADGVALLVDRELYSAEAGLRVLAASPSLAARDLRAFHAQASHATDSGRSILLYDASGRQLVNTALPFGTAMTPPGEAHTVRAIASAAKTVVSDLAPTVAKRAGIVADGTLSTAVYLPVTLADGSRYVVAKAFSTGHFVRLVQASQVAPGWLVAIIDGNGNFIARNHNAAGLVGTQAPTALVSAVRGAKSGRVNHTSVEGAPIYNVFAHPSMSRWAVSVAAPVALLDRSSRNASAVAFGGLLAAALVAIALAAWCGQLHAESIGRAVRAAVDLGNGIPPPPVHARVFEVNALHAALHAAGEQLLQAHAYRKHAETERQSLLEGEQRARAMAEQQNSAKDQFLAMLGHELRNPLAPISTAAQLLKLQSPDAARVRYASDVISRQVDHMNSLLGDLLDVSRVTRGLVSLHMEPVDLKAVIERALEQTSAVVNHKQHRLKLDLPDGPVMVNGDKTRLVQVFANLVNNAAKYTPAGGQIEIALRASDGKLNVTVADNGEGFTDALLPRIFDLFSQGERTPDRAQGGLGLGLALVQSLVRLHGGSVTAFSAGAGMGSTFTVTLAHSALPVVAAQVVKPERKRAAALAVMIVDDNIDGAISLSLFLEEAGGHRVSTYYDAGSALSCAVAEAPDVFILDIGLPDITGYELARRLRTMPECVNALFIALTGYGQPKDKQMAFEAGFDHHVSKPADPQAILGLLNMALRHA